MKKLIFKKITALALGLFVGLTTIFLSGCTFPFPSLNGGDWIKDINQQLEDGEIDQEEYDRLFKEYSGGIELDGVKVLRRPLTYDYDSNLVDEREGLEKNYYIYFANDIFDTLYRIYGIFNYRDVETDPYILDDILKKVDSRIIKNLKRGFDESNDNLKYFYDAIRYQITDVTAANDAGTPADTSDDYVEVTANTSRGWKWVQGFDEFKFDKEDIESFVYSSNASTGDIGDEINNVITNKFEVIKDNNYTEYSFSYDFVKNYYGTEDYYFKSSTYSTTFVNTDFVYTLSYAIYCIVLQMTPNNAGFNGGEWVVDGYSAINNDPATEEDESKSSARVAFEDIKKKFEKSGSYVGLTEKNKKAIVSYILKNVIGDNALNYGLQNLYYEDVVEAVVEYCGYLTTIGSSTGEGDTYIGSSFVASEIVDYPGTSFFISQNEDDPFETINSHEYQSIVFMPKNELNLTDIWMDFKYYAREGGKPDGAIINDDSLYIKIYVTVRYFDGSVMHECQQSINVYNGKYDPMNASTLSFELDAAVDGINENGLPESFGEAVKVGKFLCDALDVETNSSGERDELTNLKVLTVTGSTDARSYYEVVNSVSGYGSYGRLKQEKVGANNMSYVEITFDVEKLDSQTFDRNYDFFVGFSQLHYEQPKSLERFD